MADVKVIHVDEIDLSKRNSGFGESEEAFDGIPCYYNGQAHGEGTIICTPGHQQFVCSHFGQWIPNGRC